MSVFSNLRLTGRHRTAALTMKHFAIKNLRWELDQASGRLETPLIISKHLLRHFADEGLYKTSKKNTLSIQITTV